MIQVEVLRPIPAGGHTLQPGEVHDATNWRNVDRLVAMGKARIVKNEPVTLTTEPRRGRPRKEAEDA